MSRFIYFFIRSTAFVISALSASVLAATDILESVTFDYTKDGKAEQINVPTGSAKSIYRDPGTEVDVKFWRYSSAGDVSAKFYTTDVLNSIYLDFTTTGSPTWGDVAGSGVFPGFAWNAEVHAGVGGQSSEAVLYVYDIATPEPDLVVGSVQINDLPTTPDSFSVGETITVNCIVSNIGDGTAPESRVGFYLGNNTTDLDDRFDSEPVKSLSEDSGSVEESDPYTFTASDIGSRKYIIVKADYRGDVTDEAETGNNTAYIGPFEVTAAQPGAPTSPSPADNGTDIPLSGNLSWSSANYATSYDVYLGTDSTPDSDEFVGNTANTTFPYSSLSNDTTYYWKVVAKNTEGTEPSQVWSFTTEVGAVRSASITSFDLPSGSINRGSTVSIQVEIENTGNVTEDFWIGLSFQGPETGAWPDGWWDISPIKVSSLSPGERSTVEFAEVVPDWLVSGPYTGFTSIWDGFDESAWLMMGERYDTQSKSSFNLGDWTVDELLSLGRIGDPIALNEASLLPYYGTQIVQWRSGLYWPFVEPPDNETGSGAHVIISSEAVSEGRRVLSLEITKPSNSVVSRYLGMSDAGASQIVLIIPEEYSIGNASTSVNGATPYSWLSNTFRDHFKPPQEITEMGLKVDFINEYTYALVEWAVQPYIDSFFTSDIQFADSYPHDKVDSFNVIVIDFDDLGAQRIIDFEEFVVNLELTAPLSPPSRPIGVLFDIRYETEELTRLNDDGTHSASHEYRRFFEISRTALGFGPIESVAFDIYSERGSPNPATGGYEYFLEEAVTEGSIQSPTDGVNGVRYRCIGYSGTGDAPSGSGLSYPSFTINQDSTLTWEWVPQYEAISSSGGNGDISPSGSSWSDAGANLSYTASPNSGYQVDRWELNGSIVQEGGQSYTLGDLSGPTNITVYFELIPVNDTTPDAFTFTDLTGVARSSEQISGPITVSGINAAASISIEGGSYSVNDGVFETSAGSVVNGDQVRVKLLASANHSATTEATLTIGGVSDTFEVTTVVDSANTSPVLGPIGDQSVDELVELSFTASATDSDEPIQPLTYSLTGEPEGAEIDPSTGVFRWTPTEAQGPDTYSFTVSVSDGELSDSEEITVKVNEVNVAPVLDVIGDMDATALTQLSFTATASDSDLPAQTLSFDLANEPSGASIDPATGAFTWTPSEAQAGSGYTFTVEVSDGIDADFEEITITVEQREEPGMIDIGEVLGDTSATSSNFKIMPMSDGTLFGIYAADAGNKDSWFLLDEDLSLVVAPTLLYNGTQRASAMGYAEDGAYITSNVNSGGRDPVHSLNYSNLTRSVSYVSNVTAYPNDAFSDTGGYITHLMPDGTIYQVVNWRDYSWTDPRSSIYIRYSGNDAASWSTWQQMPRIGNEGNAGSHHLVSSGDRLFCVANPKWTNNKIVINEYDTVANSWGETIEVYSSDDSATRYAHLSINHTTGAMALAFIESGECHVTYSSLDDISIWSSPEQLSTLNGVSHLSGNNHRIGAFDNQTTHLVSINSASDQRVLVWDGAQTWREVVIDVPDATELVSSEIHADGDHGAYLFAKGSDGSVTGAKVRLARNDILQEDWESGLIDPAKWKSWGSPAPVLYSGTGSIGNSFKNNGDSMYESGVVTQDLIELRAGMELSWKSRAHTADGEDYGFYQFNEVFFTQSDLVDFDSSASFSRLIGMRHYGETGRWIQFHYGESLVDGVNRFSAASTFNQWVEFKMVFEADGSVSFYQDGALVVQSGVGFVDYSLGAVWRLVISGRSYSTNMLVDEILLSAPTAVSAFSVTFDLGEHGTRSGGGDLIQTVESGRAAIAPTIAPNPGWQFSSWDTDFSAVSETLIVTALYVEDPTTAPVVLDQSLVEFRSSGGGKNVGVTYPRGWSVAESADWITVTPGSGSGSGVFSVTVTENTSEDSRSASIAVGSTNLLIQQWGDIGPDDYQEWLGDQGQDPYDGEPEGPSGLSGLLRWSMGLHSGDDRSLMDVITMNPAVGVGTIANEYFAVEYWTDDSVTTAWTKAMFSKDLSVWNEAHSVEVIERSGGMTKWKTRFRVDTDYCFVRLIAEEMAPPSTASVNLVSSSNGSVQGTSGEFSIGSTVTLRAIPDSGYIFDHWEGLPVAVPTDQATVEFTLSGAISPQAVFAPAVPEYLSDSKLVFKIETGSTIDISGIVSDPGFSTQSLGETAVWSEPVTAYNYSGSSVASYPGGYGVTNNDWPSSVTLKYSIGPNGVLYVGASGDNDSELLSVLTYSGMSNGRDWDGSKDGDAIDIASYWTHLDLRMNLLGFAAQQWYEKIVNAGYATNAPTRNQFFERTMSLTSAYQKPIHVLFSAIYHQQADYGHYDSWYAPYHQNIHEAWSPATTQDANMTLYRRFDVSYDNISKTFVTGNASNDNRNNSSLVFDDTIYCNQTGGWAGWTKRTADIYPEKVEINAYGEWSTVSPRVWIIAVGDGISTSSHEESYNSNVNPATSYDQNPEPFLYTLQPGVNNLN